MRGIDKRELRNRDGLTEEEFLSRYDGDRYEKPSVTADMLIFSVGDEKKQNYRRLAQKTLKVLMIKRGNHPYMGQWALPGGFVSADEDIEGAALRELKEEVNIDNIYMEQLYTWGEVERDPRMRVISCSYISLVDSSSLDIRAGDDADDARWFTLKYTIIKKDRKFTSDGYTMEELVRVDLSHGDEQIYGLVRITGDVRGKVKSIRREIVEAYGIAFDHARIIQYGIERLRSKIEYTDIVFNLMAERFTLTELQQVYEVILDRRLLKANFRRKISDMVIETGDKRKDAGHRPSELYRFNAGWVKRTF